MTQTPDTKPTQDELNMRVLDAQAFLVTARNLGDADAIAWATAQYDTARENGGYFG